jgi:hypothetical protein
MVRPGIEQHFCSPEHWISAKRLHSIPGAGLSEALLVLPPVLFPLPPLLPPPEPPLPSEPLLLEPHASESDPDMSRRATE